MSSKHRRVAPRVVPSIIAYYRIPDTPKWYKVTIKDLSWDGVRMACDHVFPEGALLDLRFELPSRNEPLPVISCEVRWSRRSPGTLQVAETGMAFRLADAKQKDVITQAIRFALNEPSRGTSPSGERRSRPRLFRAFEAFYRRPGQQDDWISMTVRNFSQQGLRFESKERFNPAQTIQLRFSPPISPEEFTIHARIVWALTKSADHSEQGVEFIDVKPNLKIKLDNMVQQLIETT